MYFLYFGICQKCNYRNYTTLNIFFKLENYSQNMFKLLILIKISGFTEMITLKIH